MPWTVFLTLSAHLHVLSGGAEVRVALAKSFSSLVFSWRLTAPENVCVEQWAELSCSGSVTALLIALEQQHVSSVAAMVLKV